VVKFQWSSGIGTKEFNNTNSLPLIKYIGAIGAGFVLLVRADNYYELLDGGPFLAAGFLIFGMAMVIGLWGAVAMLSDRTVRFLRIALLLSATASLLLGLLVLCNGILDRSSKRYIASMIVSKTRSQGRGGVSYYFDLQSWRARGSTERLNVNKDVFAGFEIGDRFNVDIHEGAFGLPWYRPPVGGRLP
jgi:hypothetical protein